MKLSKLQTVLAAFCSPSLAPTARMFTTTMTAVQTFNPTEPTNGSTSKAASQRPTSRADCQICRSAHHLWLAALSQMISCSTRILSGQSTHSLHKRVSPGWTRVGTFWWVIRLPSIRRRA